MFAIERRKEILELLRKQKAVTVKDLSNKFFIGEATIRRDLEKLEKSGLLNRTYGGAVLLEGLHTEIPLYVRESERKQEKDTIACFASKYVSNGDIIIMDSSSTTMMMNSYLQSKTDVTIITNGAKTAVDLAEMKTFNVYSTGGKLRENSLSYIGETANKFFNNFNADTLFFSCRALSMKRGITDSNEEEAMLRKLMIQASRRSVLLCDSTKFDKTSFCKIGDVMCIDTIITDIKPNEEWIAFLKEQEIDLIY